jgi:hypothetical protein
MASPQLLDWYTHYAPRKPGQFITWNGLGGFFAILIKEEREILQRQVAIPAVHPMKVL